MWAVGRLSLLSRGQAPVPKPVSPPTAAAEAKVSAAVAPEAVAEPETVTLAEALEPSPAVAAIDAALAPIVETVEIAETPGTAVVEAHKPTVAAIEQIAPPAPLVPDLPQPLDAIVAMKAPVQVPPLAPLADMEPARVPTLFQRLIAIIRNFFRAFFR